MIKFWSSLKLHVQLAVASAILLAITIVLTTWFNIKSQQQALTENSTKEAVALAKNISLVSGYLVITNKLDELESLLLQSITFPIITQIQVLSGGGKKLSHAKKLDSGEIVLDFSLSPVNLPQDTETVKININWHLETLSVWHAIRTSTRVGWVNVDLSLTEVIALQEQIIYENIIAGVIAVIFDVLILLLILYIPSKNFKKIIKFSKSMTEHAGEKMDFHGGSYEINSLVEALNNTSEQLEQKNKKIQQQSDDLVDINIQKVIAEKESEQHGIIETMLESVITIDDKGNIHTFNKAAEKIFGFSEKEIIGENIIRLMPSPYSDEHAAYLQNYLKGGEAKVIGIGREVEGKRKNGEIFPMRLSVTELPQNKNGSRRFIGSCQDITEIKQKEEQLRRSQKMDALGKLTGGIAHDYNNLLAIIKGYTELLDQKLSDDPELKNYVYEINHAADRGAVLTKKILGFSQQKMSTTLVSNLNDILMNMRMMLEKTLSARIELEFDLYDGLWPVEIDDGDFEDSIVNMAINAMHAMESGGKLIFTTRNTQVSQVESRFLDLSAGDYVLLTINDTGEGMDEETKEKIFDPFFTSKGELGTGLGLSQVYGFVKQSGGDIKIDSTLGTGSIFSLYFPRCNQSYSNTEKSSNKNKIDYNPDINKTILVVDDEVALLELAKDIISMEGYQVFTANNAEEALKVVKEENIDLMITDVIMPKVDGYQLSKQVKMLYPEVKIQMVTGYSDGYQSSIKDDDLIKNILYKPYTVKTLLLAINNQLADKK